MPHINKEKLIEESKHYTIEELQKIVDDDPPDSYTDDMLDRIHRAENVFMLDYKIKSKYEVRDDYELTPEAEQFLERDSKRYAKYRAKKNTSTDKAIEKDEKLKTGRYVECPMCDCAVLANRQKSHYMTWKHFKNFKRYILDIISTSPSYTALQYVLEAERQDDLEWMQQEYERHQDKYDKNTSFDVFEMPNV